MVFKYTICAPTGTRELFGGAMLLQRAIMFAVVVIIAFQSAALAQDTTSVTSKLESGSNSYVFLDLQVPPLCTHPIAYAIIANKQNRQFPIDSPSYGLTSSLADFLDKPDSGSFESYENEIIGQVPGGRPVIQGLNDLLDRVCDAFSGELLIFVGIGPTHKATLTGGLLVQVRDGRIVRKLERAYESSAPAMMSSFLTKRALAMKQATSPAASPPASFIEFQQRIGAQVTDEFGKLRIGRMLYGGPAYVAGLRTGDLIVSIGNVGVPPESALQQARSSSPPSHWPMSVRKAKGDTIFDRIFKNMPTPIRATGKAPFTTYAEFANAGDRTFPGEYFHTSIARAVEEGSDAEREAATIHMLYTEGLAPKITRLIYAGDKPTIDQELEYDLGQALRAVAPIPGLTDILHGSRDAMIAQGYVGFAAQYAIAKAGRIGLCGQPGHGFTITTTEYKVYRNLAGTYYNEQAVAQTNTPLTVDARFAAAVTRGSQAGQVHGEHGHFLASFVALQGCDGPILKAMEANLLAHINDGALTPNAVLTITPRPDAQSAAERCRSYLKEVNPSESSDRVSSYCSCVADRASMINGAPLGERDVANFVSDLSKGYLAHSEAGCLRYFEMPAAEQAAIMSGPVAPTELPTSEASVLKPAKILPSPAPSLSPPPSARLPSADPQPSREALLAKPATPDDRVTAPSSSPKDEIVSDPPSEPRAFSPNYGYSWDYPSRAKAERKALQSCKGHCNIALWYRNACASIAIGKTGAWGAAWNVNRGNANKQSLQNCASRDAECEIKQTVCSQRGYGAFAVEVEPTESNEPSLEASGHASCEDLWHQRNAIYHQFKYCFSAPKGIAAFGNNGCFRDQDETWQAMGEDNRQRVTRIKELEEASNCR